MRLTDPLKLRHPPPAREAVDDSPSPGTTLRFFRAITPPTQALASSRARYSRSYGLTIKTSDRGLPASVHAPLS